jgi:hypothetical protein
MIGGWYLDIIVGYLVRTLVRFIKMRQSEGWPVEKGTISSAICPLASYGGPVAELGYTYIHKGEYYSGVHTKAFVLKSSAEDYVGHIVVGAEIPVRVKPAQPEVSVVVE